MKKLSIVFLLLSVLFFACTGDTSNKQEGENNKLLSTEGGGSTIAPENVKLICQAVTPQDSVTDAPQHEVFLQLGDSKVKIADVLNCQELTKDLFEQHQVPTNALSAVGGWWAGAGDYLYVVEENGNYVVKQGGTAEELESTSFNYKTVVTYSKEGKEVF